MKKEDKLVLGTLAGVDLILSPEHYEEYKGTLNKQLEEANQEIERLQNIINELEKYIEKETRIYGLSMSIELGAHFDNILGILKGVMLNE